MRGHILTFGFVALLCSSVCGQEDPNESAKALFAEATKQFSDAANAKFDAALSIYQDGLEKLDLIVAKYPASDLAIQLASGRMTGNFKIERKIRLASGSMSPTLKEGDNIVVFAYTAAPAAGDIVVYLHPKDNSRLHVHRLIGIAGDRIQMIDGHLHINAQPVKRERVEDFETVEDRRTLRIKRWRETLPNGASYNTIDLIDNGFFDNTPIYTVPPESFFVMGDNRDNATDSRVLSQVGYIPSSNVLGRAVRK
jgi:signal peptidase I